METTIGSTIKQRRQSLGMTQAQLAEVCGLTDRQLVRKYEKDISRPQYATLERICKALGLEISLAAKNNFAETLDI